MIYSTTNWLDETDSTTGPSERSVKKLEELNLYSSTRWDVILNNVEIVVHIFVFFLSVFYNILSILIEDKLLVIQSMFFFMRNYWKGFDFFEIIYLFKLVLIRIEMKIHLRQVPILIPSLVQVFNFSLWIVDHKCGFL